jgi:hypothetical protein
MAAKGFAKYDESLLWVRSKTLAAKIAWQSGNYNAALEYAGESLEFLDNNTMCVEKTDLLFVSLLSDLWNDPTLTLDDSFDSLGKEYLNYGDTTNYLQCEACRLVSAILTDDFNTAHSLLANMKQLLDSLPQNDANSHFQILERCLTGFEQAYKQLNQEAARSFENSYAQLASLGHAPGCAWVRLCNALFAAYAGHAPSLFQNLINARDYFRQTNQAHPVMLLDLCELNWLASQGNFSDAETLAKQICQRAPHIGAQAMQSIAAAIGFDASLNLENELQAKEFATFYDSAAWPGFFMLSKIPYLENTHNKLELVSDPQVFEELNRNSSPKIPHLSRPSGFSKPFDSEPKLFDSNLSPATKPHHSHPFGIEPKLFDVDLNSPTKPHLHKALNTEPISFDINLNSPTETPQPRTFEPDPKSIDIDLKSPTKPHPSKNIEIDDVNSVPELDVLDDDLKSPPSPHPKKNIELDDENSSSELDVLDDDLKSPPSPHPQKNTELGDGNPELEVKDFESTSNPPPRALTCPKHSALAQPNTRNRTKKTIKS